MCLHKKIFKETIKDISKQKEIKKEKTSKRRSIKSTCLRSLCKIIGALGSCISFLLKPLKSFIDFILI